MRTLLLVLDFIALMAVLWIARHEWAFDTGEWVIFSTITALICLNLGYILQTPASPDARIPRFFRAFRKAWRE